MVGVLDGFASEIPLFPLLNKQARICGIVTGPRRVFEKMNQELENIQIHPIIDKVYPFAELWRHMATSIAVHSERS